jgi:uncharacterized protein
LQTVFSIFISWCDILKRITKNQISEDLKSFPVVALLGPRQVGKTTLAKELTAGREDVVFLDLERPSDLSKLTDAESYLSMVSDKLVCIDEIQLRPDLFPLLRVLVDEDRRSGRFLILGSSSPELLRQSSETLAGRIAFQYVTPFNQVELRKANKYSWQDLLSRGGFPDSYLSDSQEVSLRWRENYVQTFLQRDLRQFGIEQSPEKIRRLWIMLAHSHGQVINYSKLGQSLDQTHPTVKSYIDILTSTFMVRKLLPFEVNTKKRLVKSPKVYIRDSGILCHLLDIRDFDSLFNHPSYGSCWEGLALENILSILNPKSMVGFYRSHSGEEMDLVFEWNRKRFGIEFKVSSNPKLTKQNLEPMKTLKLDHLFVVTPESDTYPLGPDVSVMSLHGFIEHMLRGDRLLFRKVLQPPP